MSNLQNDILLERAAEMIDYWEGTLHAELIRHALDSNDLDLVRENTIKAEADAAVNEVHGYGLITRSHVTEQSDWSDNCVCADCYGDFSGASNEDR